MKFVQDDGGRKEAGYKGHVGDCVTRAIAIASGKPYQEVYDALHAGIKDFLDTSRSRAARRAGRRGSPRDGVHRKVYEKYLKSLGWRWAPTMGIGTGCKVHLADGELPMGKLIVRLSGHLAAVIDGVIHDTFNPQRTTIICEGGVQRFAQRCVYGYYVKED